MVFSSASMCPMRLNAWKTNPMWRFRSVESALSLIRAVSTPSMR